MTRCNGGVRHRCLIAVATGLLPLLLVACAGRSGRPAPVTGNLATGAVGSARAQGPGESSGDDVGGGPDVSAGEGLSDGSIDSSSDGPGGTSGASEDRGSPASSRRLAVPELVETSGLAVSRRDPDVLWAINDSGHAPALHAFDRDGRTLGRWPVEAANRDWEDLAAFRLDGEPVLLIADTGDNARRRDEVVLHLVAEPIARGPGAAPGTSLVPLQSLPFRYEDGAHDVESVAVDEPDGTVWLLPKEPVRGGRGVAGGAYALALDADPPRVARRRATLARVSRGLTENLAAAIVGVDLEQPTAFDIAEDGSSGCLLTYRRARCLARADGESWDEAFARPARALPAHGLEQAEALAVEPDGRAVWITSEGDLPPLLAVPVR